MIIEYFEQGSDEWNAARVSLPSASKFKEILTGGGQKSKSAIKLIYKLAGERLTGEKEKSYSSAKMQQAIELEPEARDYFRLITGLDVREVGLCYFDDRKDRGCSPDGLIMEGDDFIEGLEIKCPIMSTHVEYLNKNELPSEYFCQVQGSLYITGLPRWHFMSYYPEMPPFHIVVERDEAWINKFAPALDEFVQELDAVHCDLIARMG
ncbi:YqaJ viral recombinase family protein [Candidatus Pacearchaeota archaeon]|nr:YqaJ viral recombinase family protein [Candidatus Pacearchaeota archaeon]